MHESHKIAGSFDLLFGRVQNKGAVHSTRPGRLFISPMDSRTTDSLLSSPQVSLAYRGASLCT